MAILTTPETRQKIDLLFQSSPDFLRLICEKLRQAILAADPELKETWKWSAPVYEKYGLICSFSPFKKHVRLSFFQGIYLSDPKKIFNSGEGNASMRSITFTHVAQVDAATITSYVREALQIEPAKTKVPTAKPLPVPPDLQVYLAGNAGAQHIFDNLPHTHRKEYILWIAAAKKPETRQRRLYQTIERLLAHKKISL